MTEAVAREEPSSQTQSNPSNGAISGGDKDAVPQPKGSSLPRKVWDKLGLNAGMLLIMAKGALPPTISLAIFQSTAFASTFSTLGYLVAIMSILSFAIMPRAKFIQTMLLNVLGICVGSAIALLTIYCSVQARAHTTHTAQSSSGGPSPGVQVAGYNASASAVSAIWLFVNIYVANTLRASYPALNFPVIVFSVFTDVASTYAPQFSTMPIGIAFVKSLLEAFLTGFAIAAGATAYIMLCQSVLKAQAAYLQTLEKRDMFSATASATNEQGTGKNSHSHKAKEGKSIEHPEAVNLKATIQALGDLHGKMLGDLIFAKREISYGKLDADDLDKISKMFRKLLLTMTGMSSAANVFDRIAEMRGWASKFRESNIEEETNIEKQKQMEKGQWNEIMKSLHDPFENMTRSMIEGLQHVLYTLELTKAPKKSKAQAHAEGENGAFIDVEANGDEPKPGTKDFALYFTSKIDGFYEQRKVTLAGWCRQKGIGLDAAMFDDPSKFVVETEVLGEDLQTHQRNQRQLYTILYMEFLLYSSSRAILDLVNFADLKVTQGVMKKKRIIIPSGRRLKEWFFNACKSDDGNTENTPDATESGSVMVFTGESGQSTKDPEHLPPTNGVQRFGNFVRGFSRIFRSTESAFGFRVACATLSIGIVAYLRDTQVFFNEQRLVWAMIMVSIGMTLTAGAGVFGFFGRVTGTVIAVCTSLVIWYIVDGKTGGIIPILWLFMFIEFYFVLKFPRFTVIAILSMVTQVLIIGYELQVRKIGAKVATSNGQPFYPIYLLAPYRLACVSGGMLVAFIWTFFPYPLTARSQLRKDLGASLYLLANFYSCVHTTVGLRLRNLEGDMNSTTSPGRKLETARNAVYGKELALLAGLRQHSAFTAWEPTLGGKFPKKQYDTIINEVQNILNYMALISHASSEFINKDDKVSTEDSWVQNLSRLLKSINVTSHEITSMLSLLSASVTNGHPLPPYLKVPPPYQLTGHLEAMDADILSINHIAEPGYAAFAVMQIASGLISNDLGKLIANVKALVGEVDFSFHVISTSTDRSDDSLWSAGADKGKTD